MVANSLLHVIRDGDVHSGIGIFHERPARFRFRTFLIGAYSAARRHRKEFIEAPWRIAAAIANSNSSTTLECPENPAPAHDSRMQHGIRVGEKPLPNLAGIPGALRRFQ